MNFQNNEVNYPCRGCTKRVLGCHSNCEEYAEAARKAREIGEKKKARFEIIQDEIERARTRKKK